MSWPVRARRRAALPGKPAEKIALSCRVIEQAIAPHRRWISLSQPVRAGYNTNLISKDRLPDLADLVRPLDGQAWHRGRGFRLVCRVVRARRAGIAIVSEIVDTNGISVRKGHSLLNNLVAAAKCRWR
jgi:iron(III) transport system substrate-binding protein